MNFQEINSILFKSSLNDSDAFINCYLENEEQIISALKTTEKIKTEIYLKDIDKELIDSIRFSSIFSDVTIINNTYSEKAGAKVHLIRPESKYFIQRQLTIPVEELSLPVEAFDFFPC